jgi:hypothetical protein
MFSPFIKNIRNQMDKEDLQVFKKELKNIKKQLRL